MNGTALPTIGDADDYPKVTRADLVRATFRVGLKPAPRKRRVTILLDTVFVEYFKAKAGERGYQTLIIETLRQAVEHDGLEEMLRRIIREELASSCVESDSPQLNHSLAFAGYCL